MLIAASSVSVGRNTIWRHNSECGRAKPIASYSSAIVTRSRTAVASNHESNASSGRGAVRNGNARSADITDARGRSKGPAFLVLGNPRNLTLAKKEGRQRFVTTAARMSPEPLTRMQLEALSEDAFDEDNRQRRVWHADLGPIKTAQLAALHARRLVSNSCRVTRTILLFPPHDRITVSVPDGPACSSATSRSSPSSTNPRPHTNAQS